MTRKITALVLVFISLSAQQSCTEESQGVEFTVTQHLDVIEPGRPYIKPSVKYRFVKFNESRKIDLKLCHENLGIPVWIPDYYFSTRYKNDSVCFTDDTVKSINGKIVLDTTHRLEEHTYYDDMPNTQLTYDNKGRLVRYDRLNKDLDDKSPHKIRVEYDDMNRVKNIIEETFWFGDMYYIIEYDEQGDINKITQKTKKQTVLEVVRSPE